MTRWPLTLTLGLLLTAIMIAPLAAQNAPAVPPAPAPAAAPATPPAPAADNPAPPAEAPAGPAKHELPEPSVLPASWQLDMTFQRPMRLVLQMPGQKDPTYFYYVLYTITNNSNKDVNYLPRIQLLTDDLELVGAQVAISPVVFGKIKALHKAKYLEEPLQVIGKILGGANNARDTVAVFPLKKDPKSFKLFFAGLSGEQRTITIPSTTAGGQPEQATMEKVREIEFQVPGNTSPDKSPEIVQVPNSDKWIMRMAPKATKMDVDLQAASAGKLNEVIKPADQMPPPVTPKVEPLKPAPPASVPATTPGKAAPKTAPAAPAPEVEK